MLIQILRGVIKMTNKELLEEISLKDKNAFLTMSEAELKDMNVLCDGYKKYHDDGKTERECVDISIKMAEENGFVNIENKKDLKAGDKVYIVNRGKAMLLAVIGTEPMENGLNIVGAHIDSPRIDLKQNPLYEDGEMAFRDMETDLLKRLQNGENQFVLSIGGGMPVREENRALLRNLGTVIYLKTSKEEIIRRVSGDKNRPLLQGGDLEEKVTNLMNARECIYIETAHVEIVTDGKTPEQVVKEIQDI